jgi:hypothetical protein
LKDARRARELLTALLAGAGHVFTLKTIGFALMVCD